MPLLYVDYVDGKKRMLQIAESGGYFDSNKIIHDERSQGPMPQNFIDDYAALLEQEQADQAASDAALLENIEAAKVKLVQVGLSPEEVDAILSIPNLTQSNGG